MFRKSRSQITLAATIVIVVSVALILLFSINATNTLVTDVLHQQSKTANNSFINNLTSLETQALERAEMISTAPDVIDAVKNKDTALLVTLLKNLSPGLDLITLCDADGNVLARTHSDKVGDNVKSQKAISTALSTGKGIMTIEPGTVIGLSTRGSAAIKDENGRIVGALTCGHDLSLSKYIDQVKTQNGCEATFFAGDVRMSTTIPDENGNRAVGTKASDVVVQTVLQQGQDYKNQMNLFGKTYDGYYSPIKADGQIVGMLFTGIQIDTIMSNQQTINFLLIVAMILLAVSVVITFMLISTSTKRTHWYESILDSLPFPISVTNMNMNWTFVNRPVEDMLKKKRSELIGKHCSSWGAGICNTANCGINCLKNGKNETFFEQFGLDFQVNTGFLHEPSGKQIGHIEVVRDITDMKKTQKAQAKLVDEISQVSSAFVDATRSIASGAQALAQGATEQASSIDELSATIADINSKTSENSQTATKAASLAQSIKENAERSTDQMKRMTKAVEEIDQASRSIGTVIKVIDDIAFQTNILALNAAVEAARAGQHGKGFAVVSEEVRNLAAKSAEAAKNTADLIASSIDKAKLGVEISKETDASLSKIVEGIKESNILMDEIARSSESQIAAINQINTGIEQVSIVVQQNSATAQESAAASEQMSGQSATLQNLIDDFMTNK